MPPGKISGFLPRCPACRNTLDEPGQFQCEQCGTETPRSPDSHDSRPQYRGASPVDLTASSPVFQNTKETAIEILDSDPVSPISSSYRTASSSPLPSLAELFTKFYQARAEPKQEASLIKQEEEEEAFISHDAWATKPRPNYPGQIESRPRPSGASDSSLPPPIPATQSHRPRVIPHAMTIAGSHQASAAATARKEQKRPNAGSFALSHRPQSQTGKSKFGSQREIVRLALFEVQGYYAQPSDKELDPPFLTPSQFRILGIYILSLPINHAILILF
jgi:hypothetical protein